MECPFCGNQLSIEDEKCPFCGEINSQAKQYTAKMKTYKKEWSKAKNKVDETTHYVRSFTVPLIVTIVLAVLNIIVLILRVNVYEVEDFIIERDIERNYDTYCTQLIDYLEQEDYYSFNRFYQMKDMYISDSMEKFNHISSIARHYSSIFNNSRYLINQEEGKVVWETGELVEKLGSELFNLYEMVYSDVYKYSRKKMPPEYQKYIDRIIENTEHLCAHYLNMSAEDIDNLKESNKTQISVVIGRRLGINGY